MEKKLKLQWLKRSKTAPKNEIWIRKQMIQNLLFGVVFPLLLDFLVESQSQEKLAIRTTHFTIQFRCKNTTHLTNLNSLSIQQKKYSRIKVKNFTHFINLPENLSPSLRYQKYRTMKWEIFGYIPASAYHVISKEVENRMKSFLDTHVCVNNPYGQSSGIIIFFCF